MRTVSSIAILTGLVLSSSQVAQAQRPDSISLARLRPNQFVRVETPALGRVQGRVAGNSGSGLRLVNSTEHVVLLPEIRRAWVRGRRTGLGAIVGGVLGAGGGLFLGLLVDAVCEYDCHGSAVAVTLIGTGVGAGLGAIVGAAIPHWKEVH